MLISAPTELKMPLTISRIFVILYHKLTGYQNGSPQKNQTTEIKKAAGINGLTAEHIKAAHNEVTQFLTPIINKAIEMGEYPISLKEGIRHPILKKNTVMTNLGNHSQNHSQNRSYNST